MNQTTPNPETKKYIKVAGALFHRHSRGLDFVRNPYRVWALGCLVFVAVIVAVIALDGWVAIKLKDGGFNVVATVTPVPPPIIDKDLLIKTAALYGDRAATVTLLETSTTTVPDPAAL
jgi:hypothetical protein